jgi:outer membrane protein
MSNKLRVMTGFFLGILFLILPGCDELEPQQSFYKMTVDPETLHSVDNLTLTEKPQQPDTNEPPYLIDVNRPQTNDVNLTLEQCRAYTLADNLNLKVQLIEPAIAAQRINEEEAKFEAALYSNVNFAKTDMPVSSELEGSRSESTSVDLGVTVPLKTGGTVSINLADQKFETNNPYSTLNPAYSSDLSVSISQPLLRGAGKRTNTYAIRLANYDLSIAQARTKLEVIRILTVADRVYWRLYAARKLLEVRQKEFEVAKAELEKTKRLVKFGMKPEVEIVRAESGVAERLESVIVANNDLRDREREAKQIMNMSLVGTSSRVNLVPVTEPDPVRYNLNPAELAAMALENRMEMLELELQIAQQAEAIDYYKNLALPLVTLDYTYNINGLGATRGDSYDLLFDKRFEDHFLGLNILIPLGNEQAKSRVRQAFLRRKQSIATKEDRKIIIESDVLRVIDQLEADWQRILATRQNTILADKVFQAEQRQYEKGLRTMTEVLNAQAKFADAVSSEIAALTEYQIAQVDLAYATGTVAGLAKVRWQTEGEVSIQK